ncbi:hypothetical protein HYH03_007852 [Edaphochlamys debaryana]|uniref:non-specific serine/threonine protein kinase n=1 Tax=Edaphochlamys debaryana TaxID=47281 RepID=A0A836BYK1_9CHLO|nr:hypothetical protein HYH03_007852 [Edaphochlamys debaryana]|eukprot:KAG2493916.1 hypothetical protein HYH03_007852 [Edaphochlamys debaryana]
MIFGQQAPGLGRLGASARPNAHRSLAVVQPRRCAPLGHNRQIAGSPLHHPGASLVTRAGPGPGPAGSDAAPPTRADPNALAAATAAAASAPASLTFPPPPERSGPPPPPAAATPFQPGQAVGGGRYTIEEVLGAGSNAVAYRARRADSSSVALKALSLRSLRDWKQLELFEREARTLASLQHPAIPRYVDYFEEDGGGDKAFVLVQEVVEGKSLGALIREGARCPEAEVERIAGEMLGVLGYLGGLRPPVIHRDVKPDNIVLEGGTWGGRVYLVDFGGVQAVASAGELAGLGSTIVGTYGYMAPEQFRGAAEPASDLYALGATLLYLLTGQPPSAFTQERMRINWRAGLGRSQASSVSPRLAALLDGLLEPLAEDRLTAEEAQRVLQGKPLSSSRDKATSGFAARKALRRAPPPPPQSVEEAFLQQMAAASRAPAVRVGRPAGTRVQLSSSDSRLDIEIPPRGFTADSAFTGAFAVAWNAFVAIWTFSALASGGILFALFSAPFWLAGAQLAKGALGGALTRERLAIGPRRWRLGQQLAVLGDGGKADFLEGQNEKLQEGLTTELTAARVVTTAFINGVPQTCIEILAGVNRFRFGEGLETVEQQWLVGEINDHIAAVQGRELDLDALPPPDMPRVLNDDTEREREAEREREERERERERER